MSTDGDVDPAALESYVATVRSALESDPSMSARTAELRLTQPLLETLGWDLHGGAVAAGYRTDESTVGYALCPGEAPRAFVDTAAPAEGLTPEDGERLLAAMRSAGVDRGLLTDGHTVAVVTGPADDPDHRRIDVAALPDHAATLAQFSRDALDDERAAAARRLRAESDAVRNALTETLVETTEGRCEAALADAVETFLDRLVASLDGTTGEGPSAASEAAGAAESGGSSQSGRSAESARTSETAPEASPDPTGADEGRDESGAEASGTTGTTEETDEATAAAAGGPDGAGTEVVRSDSEEEGEFVVRFFDGGTSVGAVGGSAPMSALLQATELLERQRALLAGLDTPWAPGDDHRVVLTDEPVGDGPTRQLPTGHYLATDLTEGEARTAVEGLASAAGLRVMFQGDWPDG